MRRATRRGSGEAGFLTAQFVLAVGLSLVLFTSVANLVVYQYARGVVRSALDEGVRQGSRVGSEAITACAVTAEAVLADLAGGGLSEQVVFHGCAQRGAVVTASATASLRGWLPTVPDWTFDVAAEAVQEAEP